MSTRTALRPHVVIDAADMATDIISEATILQSLSCGSYTVTWSGASPVGSLTLQVSDDYKIAPNGTVENAGTWIDAPVSESGTTLTSIPITGNSGDGYIEILGTGAYAMRLYYAAASGDGTMTAKVTGKVT